MDPILYSSRITMSQSNTSASSGIPRRGLFVAGSNTDVGKTQVSVSILESLVGVGEQNGVRRRVAAFKPVASGLTSIDDPKGDVFRLWNASSKDWPLDWSGDQCFLAPLAPPLAARIEQTNVDEPRMLKGVERWKDDCDFLLVEGAGGLLSPISWRWTNADLAERLGYPIIIVVDNRLGAVNQALMTLEAAEMRGLEVRCIVLNDVTFVNDSGWGEHRELLERFLSPKNRDGEKRPMPKILRHAHGEHRFSESVDWFSLGETEERLAQKG